METPLKNNNPKHELTEADARKGGLNSVEARKRKKNMQQLAQIILDLSTKTGKQNSVEEIQSLAEINGKNLSVAEAILLKQVEKALKGDTTSAQFVRDTSGNKPIEVQQVIETPQIIDDIE